MSDYADMHFMGYTSVREKKFISKTLTFYGAIKNRLMDMIFEHLSPSMSWKVSRIYMSKASQLF